MNSTKKYLFVFLLFLILIPWLQKSFPFVDVVPLNGSYELAKIPDLSLSSWFSGDFQAKFESGLEQNIGFRSSFVRLNNQIDYSLFNFACANHVVIGKENCLYEEYYITAHTGNDHVSENEIKIKIAKLRFVQTELEKRGKHLLILFAPSKASYYPEYIPDRYHPNEKRITNYDIYLKLLGTSGLHYIDFNSLFTKMKDTSSYPLFPKQGVHWSYYGASVAMDSLLKYIKYNFNINLPQMSVKKLYPQPGGWTSDNDIGLGMNLMFEMPEYKLVYPGIEYEKDSTKTRPNVLAIGDSYYFTFSRQGLHSGSFKNDNFWFYNKTIYYDFGKERPVNNNNLEQEISQQDIIVLLQTEPYYNNVGFGFVESAYDLFKKEQNNLIKKK